MKKFTCNKNINGLIALLLFSSYELFSINGLMGRSAGREEEVSYQDVAGILDEYCIACHNGPSAPLDLRLDSLSELLIGSEEGPVVVAGRPEESELILRIRGLSEPRMPLSGPPWLSDAEIAVFVKWITLGMPKQAGAAQEETSEETNANVETADSSLMMKNITYKDVAPIFKLNCVKCHAKKGLKGAPPENFRMDNYEDIIAADYRARVVAGIPLASEIIRKIRGQSFPKMPLDGPPYLNDQQIALITAWVQQGARDSNGQKAQIPQGAKVRLRGQLSDLWALDGLPLLVNHNTRLKKNPGVGVYVEVRGRLLHDGKVSAERIRRR
ncbi:MAG: c-type cytochrome domain-containing protein [bacterium]